MGAGGGIWRGRGGRNARDGTRSLIEGAGAHLVFTPPYSPEFNPIEECWSKVKAVLKTLAARTRKTLDEAVSYALSCVTPLDAAGWFRHAGL